MSFTDKAKRRGVEVVLISSAFSLSALRKAVKFERMNSSASCKYPAGISSVPISSKKSFLSSCYLTFIKSKKRVDTLSRKFKNCKPE